MAKTDVFGSGWNSRTGVEEYGGSCIIARGGVILFSDYVKRNIFKVQAGGEPVAVTPGISRFDYIFRRVSCPDYCAQTTVLIATPTSRSTPKIRMYSYLSLKIILLTYLRKSSLRLYLSIQKHLKSFLSCLVPIFTPQLHSTRRVHVSLGSNGTILTCHGMVQNSWLPMSRIVMERSHP